MLLRFSPTICLVLVCAITCTQKSPAASVALVDPAYFQETQERRTDVPKAVRDGAIYRVTLFKAILSFDV